MKLNEKAKRGLDSITVRRTFTKTKRIIEETPQIDTIPNITSGFYLKDKHINKHMLERILL